MVVVYKIIIAIVSISIIVMTPCPSLPLEIVVVIDNHGIGGDVNVEIAALRRVLCMDNPGDVINVLLFAIGTGGSVVLPEPRVDTLEVETVFALQVYLFTT